MNYLADKVWGVDFISCMPEIYFPGKTSNCKNFKWNSRSFRFYERKFERLSGNMTNIISKFDWIEKIRENKPSIMVSSMKINEIWMFSLPPYSHTNFAFHLRILHISSSLSPSKDKGMKRGISLKLVLELRRQEVKSIDGDAICYGFSIRWQQRPRFWMFSSEWIARSHRFSWSTFHGFMDH